MSKPANDVTRVAEDYYDSADADNFYQEIWGGEDIHVGLYEQGDTIREASHKTVLQMADRLQGIGPDAKVLDIGSGYGGAARVLAERFRCHVTCLNLSDVENARNTDLSKQQGLADRITVLHGSFEDIPLQDETVDIVWSQDAILHSGDRRRVLREVARVLRPGGEFIFTDPMQADTIDDPSALRPVYERIHLNSLASFDFYRTELTSLGFSELSIEDLTPQLSTHYGRVAQELKNKRDQLAGKVSTEYIDRMLNGLSHWVAGGENGYLKWGILHFKK